MSQDATPYSVVSIHRVVGTDGVPLAPARCRVRLVEHVDARECAPFFLPTEAGIILSTRESGKRIVHVVFGTTEHDDPEETVSIHPFVPDHHRKYGAAEPSATTQVIHAVVWNQSRGDAQRWLPTVRHEGGITAPKAELGRIPPSKDPKRHDAGALTITLDMPQGEESAWDMHIHLATTFLGVPDSRFKITPRIQDILSTPFA